MECSMPLLINSNFSIEAGANNVQELRVDESNAGVGLETQEKPLNKIA